MFEDGAARWPDCADLLKATARIRVAKGDFKGAIEICTRYLNDQEEDAEFWQIGAEMMLELGLWDKAQIWAERGVRARNDENAELCLGTSGEVAFGSLELEKAADLWARSQNNAVSQAGLVLIRVLLAEPIPREANLSSPAFLHGMKCLVRRIHKSPSAADLSKFISEGLSARSVPDASLQQLLSAEFGVLQQA